MGTGGVIVLNRYCLLDLETVCGPDALDWSLPIEPDPKMVAEMDAPVEPDKRLTDPKKIADDIAKKTAAKAELPAKIADDMARRTTALLEAASFDPDLNRIVCFGRQTESEAQPCISLAMNEQQEIAGLDDVWHLVTLSRPMVGYGLTWFDLGVLVRRSQLLGVHVPAWVYDQGKYRHDVVVELADYLTLNGMIDQKKGRGLDYHCKRFGIHVEDPTSGKDIGTLWKDGQVEAIKHHNRADLERIRRVAERLGVIDAVVQELAAEATGAF